MFSWNSTIQVSTNQNWLWNLATNTYKNITSSYTRSSNLTCVSFLQYAWQSTAIRRVTKNGVLVHTWQHWVLTCKHHVLCLHLGGYNRQQWRIQRGFHGFHGRAAFENTCTNVLALNYWGFEGVRSNPPFGLQKILYIPLNCTIEVPYRLNSGPLVSLLFGESSPSKRVWLQLCEPFVHGRPARNARVSCLRCCDERTWVNTCVNRSALERSPVVVLVMSPHLLFCQP